MKIHFIISATLVALLLPGCSGEKSHEPEFDPDALLVSFTITIPETVASTRAGWEDYEPDKNPVDGEDGNEFECSLLNITPVLYSYDSVSKELGQAECKVVVYSLTKNGTSDNGATYTAYGRLDTNKKAEELREGNYRLMILANTDDSGVIEASAFQPGEKQFSFYKLPSDEFQAIPMWGVAKADLSEIEPGKLHEIGDLYLLRSMAKVRVSVNSDVATEKKVVLSSLTLNKVNQSGFVSPAKWSSLDATTELLPAESLRIPEDVTPMSDQMMTDQRDENGKLYFYLPEIENNNTTEREDLILTVDYTVDGVEREGKIYFCNYSDGIPVVSTPYDIVRNHIYDFTITGVPDNAVGLEVFVAVKDWERKYYEIVY